LFFQNQTNMKKIIIFAGIIFFIASCNNSDGWTASQRSQFVSDCTGAATGGMDASKAKSYCECMQPKIESKYPSFAKANKITTADLQTPEWTEEVKKCLQ
jgi:hypothetical protein